MDIVGIAPVIVALTLVVLAAFLIPAVIEIRKTASAMRDFITGTDSELKPLLRDLQSTLADLKGITDQVSTRTEDVKSFMEALGDTGRNLRTINSVVGAVSGTLASSSLWLTGAKVAGKFIIDRFSKKRGK
jgi:uncharacterized protein YoxC